MDLSAIGLIIKRVSVNTGIIVAMDTIVIANLEGNLLCYFFFEEKHCTLMC